MRVKYLRVNEAFDKVIQDFWVDFQLRAARLRLAVSNVLAVSAKLGRKTVENVEIWPSP